MAAYSAIVVGAGGVSNVWLPALKAEKVNVAALVDVKVENAERQADHFKIEPVISDNLKAVLRDVKADFLLDLTVPESHCEVTCLGLEAGLHVLGEKPMASSMGEARKMVRTADRTGKTYMVSQSRRWQPDTQALARAVARKKIGTLTSIHCDFFLGAHFDGFRLEMPSPLLFDMSIHHFDMARMISGTDPLEVYAEEYNPSGSWYQGDAAVTAIFRMTGDVVFTYRGSWCTEGCHTPWNGNWRITGDRGSILYEYSEIRSEVVSGNTGFTRPLKKVPVAKPALKMRDQHGGLREFLGFLRTGRKPICECHDNIRSLAMVFAAGDSARKGKRVKVTA